MKSFTIACVSALSAVALAAPAPRAAPAITDADILNYALTLEHLEDTFYRQGLKNYTEADFTSAGFTPTFYQDLTAVARDEKTHVSFLTSALKAAGAPAVAECTYNFGVTSAKSFIATASILEGVGVSAYLGAAASIANKAYLTAAGSILTVESRHSAYIRAALNQSPFPSPFDVPLPINEVYTLAAQFIVSCPKSNPALPVKAFPTLSVSSKTAQPVKEGGKIYVTASSLAYNRKVVSAAWFLVTGPIFTEAKCVGGNTYEVTVPSKAVEGQSYVVLNSNSNTVSDDTVVAGPAIVEVTPPYKL